MKNPSPKLLHILIGKALIEVVLVGVIAVGFNVVAFPPTFHGWGEADEARRAIAGWAVNNSVPWERVEVQLFVDGKFLGDQVAVASRPDVAKADWARDEWHGYNFAQLQLSAGQHEARVYVVHPSGGGSRYTLQLLGDPIRFVVNVDGTWVRAN
jgi:hypothetical protein